MTSTTRIAGFRGEYLRELEIATRQSIALAEAFPLDTYGWRPDPQARAVSEVFLHVAVGCFMLLDVVGIVAPGDLYGGVPEGGRERFRALVQRSDEIMASVREKMRSSTCCADRSRPCRNRSGRQATPNSTGACISLARKPRCDVFTCECWSIPTNTWVR